MNRRLPYRNSAAVKNLHDGYRYGGLWGKGTFSRVFLGSRKAVRLSLARYGLALIDLRITVSAQNRSGCIARQAVRADGYNS